MLNALINITSDLYSIKDVSVYCRVAEESRWYRLYFKKDQVFHGFYSNKSRGMRKKAGTDHVIPTIAENETSSEEWRQNWARLIQKVCEVDPLLCPKCQREMRIISFIHDDDLIEII